MGKSNVKPDRKMVSVNEMAELTGLSIFTIYHMMKSHTLPWEYYQVTPTKRVSRLSDVLAWLEGVRIPARDVNKTNKEVMTVV